MAYVQDSGIAKEVVRSRYLSITEFCQMMSAQTGRSPEYYAMVVGAKFMISRPVLGEMQDELDIRMSSLIAEKQASFKWDIDWSKRPIHDYEHTMKERYALWNYFTDYEIRRAEFRYAFDQDYEIVRRDAIERYGSITNFARKVSFATGFGVDYIIQLLNKRGISFSTSPAFINCLNAVGLRGTPPLDELQDDGPGSLNIRHQESRGGEV